MKKEILKDIIDSLRNGTVPAEGTGNIAVGIDDEMAEIAEQLNNVRNGKSSFKFVIGDYGSGKTFFSTAVREMAYDKGFAVSSVVVSQETPLHKFEELYRKIMDGMRIPDNNKIPAFTLILEEWLLNIEDKIIEIEGIDPEGNKEQFEKEMNKRINEELQVVGSIAASFANAIRGFYKAKYDGNHILYQGAIAWLKGESIRPEIRKGLNVAGSVTRENSFEFFKALLHMIKSAGYHGLIIIIDEVETVQKLRSDYRHAAYENLRFFIDEADKNNFPNCFFLYTGTTDLMESEKGFKSLEPLYQRVKVEREKEFKNLRQPVMFLDGFNKNKLNEVAKKVRGIHGDVYSWMPNEKVNDLFVEKLIEDMTTGFGGEITIGPRGFLRTLVDILDKSQMHDEYQPEKHFKFDDKIRSIAESIENTTAHIVNF
ncbi:MAG: BREX system ATP-binding protein BrxD [Bacillota bacterium]